MKSSLKKILIAVIFVVLICNGQQAFGRVNSVNAVSSSSIFFQPLGVTKAAFRKIKIGMSFTQCNKIIGFQGTVMTRNVGGGKVFTSVKWEGRNYAIITAVFRDNILTDKYEANLR